MTIRWLPEQRILEYRASGTVTRDELQRALGQPPAPERPAGILVDCTGLQKSPSNLLGALLGRVPLDESRRAVIQAATSSHIVTELLARIDSPSSAPRCYPTRQAALEALGGLSTADGAPAQPMLFS